MLHTGWDGDYVITWGTLSLWAVIVSTPLFHFPVGLNDFFKVWGSSNNPSLRQWIWGCNLCEVIWSGRIRSSAGSRTEPHNTCCSCQGLYHGDAWRSRDLFMSLLWLCVVRERVFMVCPLLWHGRGGRRKFSSSRRRGYLPFLESLLER